MFYSENVVLSSIQTKSWKKKKVWKFYSCSNAISSLIECIGTKGEDRRGHEVMGWLVGYLSIDLKYMARDFKSVFESKI